MIDIGRCEQTDGQNFINLSRVRIIVRLLLEDVDFERMVRTGDSRNFEPVFARSTTSALWRTELGGTGGRSPSKGSSVPDGRRETQKLVKGNRGRRGERTTILAQWE